MYKKIVVLVIYVTLVRSEGVYKKCGGHLQCIEQEMIKYVDDLDQEGKVNVLGDVLVLQKIGKESSPRAEETLVDRCVRFLTSHELKLSVGSFRDLESSPRTRKLRRIILPLLLLLKLKATIVVAVVLSVIALVAFNGLGAGLTALAISGAIGLKSLLEGHGSKLTYEVVPQIAPHWGRTGVEAAAQGYHTVA